MSRIDSGLGAEDVVLLVLEWLGEQGYDAMIRVDAERLAEGRPAWTFALGRGPRDISLRADGRTAAECMTVAVSRLRAAGLDVPA